MQTMRTQEGVVSRTLSFLASLPLFAEVDEASLLPLAQESTFRQVEKGDVLFLQSSPSEMAYVVSSGRISITLNSPDGREMVINEMQAGDLFGELGILTRKSHSTSAIARMKSEVLAIPRRALLKILQSEHSVALRMRPALRWAFS